MRGFTNVSTLVLLASAARTACVFSFSIGGHIRGSRHVLRLARSYGPQDDVDQKSWEISNEERVARQKKEFRQLIDNIVGCSEPDFLPRIVTQNIDLVLSLRGFEGGSMLKEIIDETKESGDEERVSAVEEAAEYVLSFVEEFVEQAVSIDKNNKLLLGKIVKKLTSGRDDQGGRPGMEEEAKLDEVFENEKDNFTPGFLRHLEGECNRIATAPKMSPESSKMLQTLRIIQARVVEELGEELGEGAVVLGQLLGYDDRNERLAVLDAGLTVRGIAFAKELAGLTAEALEGFTNVPGEVDPGLIRIVGEIDDRIKQFIAKNSETFQ